MVRIVKGNLVNNVSKSTFDNYFKPQGWEIVGGDYTPPVPEKEEEEIVKVESNDGQVEEVNDEEWDEVLDELSDDEAEKPLSEMNKEELVNKAKKMGIDVSNLTTNKQLREAIRNSSLK